MPTWTLSPFASWCVHALSLRKLKEKRLSGRNSRRRKRNLSQWRRNIVLKLTSRRFSWSEGLSLELWWKIRGVDPRERKCDGDDGVLLVSVSRYRSDGWLSDIKKILM